MGTQVRTATESARARERRSRGRVRRAARTALLHAVLIVIAALFLSPFLFAVSTSLKGPAEIFEVPPRWIPRQVQWSNYSSSLTALPFGRYLVNTLIIALGRMIALVLSCSLVAFAFSRLRWRGRNVLFAVVLATLMIPDEVLLIPQYIIFSKAGWVNTFLPFIVPGLLANNAFYIFLFRQFFMTIPHEIDEAARIDGASYFTIYWRIILPLSKPALASACLLIFQANWVSFLQPLVYLQRRELFTLSLGLSLFQEENYTNWSWLMAASLAVSLPLVVIFYFAQRRFVQGWASSGLKG